MKTIITTLLLFLSYLSAFSQIPVTDAALVGYLTASDGTKSADNQARFLKEFTELKKQGEYLKEKKDLIQKINSGVRNSQQVHVIMYKQDKLVRSTLRSIDRISESGLDPRAKGRAIQRLMRNRDEAKLLFQMVKKVLIPGDLKMNDAERFQYMNDVETKIDKSQSNVNAISKTMDKVIELNKFYDNKQ